MVGTPIGSLFTSSQFLNIGSTAAMMLAVGEVLADFSQENVLTALVTLQPLANMLNGWLKQSAWPPPTVAKCVWLSFSMSISPPLALTRKQVML